MAVTNYVNRIAVHANAEQAVPTLPALGSNIADLSGWVIIGSRHAGADVDLAGEDIAASFLDEKGEVRAPRSLCREEVVNFANGIDELSFTCYDGAEALLALGSSLTTTSHVTEAVSTVSYRTVLVEVNGVWVDYYPKCTIDITSSGGGYVGDPVVTEVMVRPCGTATVRGGWQRHYYQPA